MKEYKSVFKDIVINKDDVECIRDRIRYYMFDQDYENSVFWSEKLYLLANEDADLYTLLQSLISARRFRYAIQLIEMKYSDMKLNYKKDIIPHIAPLWVRYFAAKCYSNVGQAQKAMDLLHDVVPIISDAEIKNNTIITDSYMAKSQLLSGSEKNFVDENLLISSAARLKGTILEFMGKNNAVGYFVTSLSNDIYNIGAGRKLFENRMITPCEAKSLINEYEKIINSSSGGENKFMRMALAFYLISSGLRSPFIQEATNNNSNSNITGNNVRSAAGESSITSENDKWSESLENYVKFIMSHFNNSLDILRWKSDYYINTDVSSVALNLTNEIVNRSNMDDPLGCVLHALTLFKCFKSVNLKVLADAMAQDANISINKQIVYRIVCSIRDLSCGFASKSQDSLRVAVKLCSVATLRNTPWLISPAILWIILGHAAWVCGDKEHALASFNSATDISPGCYITWFFIGALHAETDEISLALTYYLKAHRIAKKNLTGVPLYMANEIAATVCKKGNYPMAIQIILNSLNMTSFDEAKLLNYIVRKKKPVLFTTLLHNLSYCYFKSGEMDKAFCFSQLANGIDRGTIQNQKLYAFLLDYVGQHKEAQFAYQTIALETARINEFKHTSKILTGRDYHLNQTLPPRTNAAIHAKEYDIFSTRMTERSLFLERTAGKNGISGSKTATTSNDNDKSSINLPNTSLSFDNDKTFT